MNLYEVINPSDQATFYAPSIEVAAVAMLMLDGMRGKYGASLVGGEESTPVMFGWEDWLKDRGILPEFDGWMDSHLAEVRDALSSVALGSPNDRADFDDACTTIADETARADFIKRRNDRRRSSLNDFESRAHEIARSLRARGEATT